MFQNIFSRSPEKRKVDLREEIVKMSGENEIELLVDLVLDSINKQNLITFFEIDSVEDFDVTILKAVFKG